jgi:hypothetical protein
LPKHLEELVSYIKTWKHFFFGLTLKDIKRMAANVHQLTPRAEFTEASSLINGKSERFYSSSCSKFLQHFSASDAAYKLFSTLLIQL